jgi:hypothetical protein
MDHLTSELPTFPPVVRFSLDDQLNSLRSTSADLLIAM